MSSKTILLSAKIANLVSFRTIKTDCLLFCPKMSNAVKFTIETTKIGDVFLLLSYVSTHLLLFLIYFFSWSETAQYEHSIYSAQFS